VESLSSYVSHSAASRGKNYTSTAVAKFKENKLLMSSFTNSLKPKHC